MKHENIKLEEAKSVKGVITVRAYKAGTKELVQEIVTPNLIMLSANHGRDILVQWLIAAFTATTVPTGINYGAIGTGQTAPALTDTQLTTETVRSSPSAATNNGLGQAQLQFFFPDANLANGTYYEFGTFIAGTASANSGYIFNHALFSTPYAKTTGTDTTVEVDIQF